MPDPKDGNVFDRLGISQRVLAQELPERQRAAREAREAQIEAGRQRGFAAARETARVAAARGSRFHFWTSTLEVDVAPTIEGFDAEGWDLCHFTTHFRNFDVGVGLGAVADAVMQSAQKKSGGGKSWSAQGDVYNLLFRYRAANANE